MESQAADRYLHCTEKFMSEGEGSGAIEEVGDWFLGETTTGAVGLDYLHDVVVFVFLLLSFFLICQCLCIKLNIVCG